VGSEQMYPLTRCRVRDPDLDRTYIATGTRYERRIRTPCERINTVAVALQCSQQAFRIHIPEVDGIGIIAAC